MSRRNAISNTASHNNLVQLAALLHETKNSEKWWFASRKSAALAQPPLPNGRRNCVTSANFIPDTAPKTTSYFQDYDIDTTELTQQQLRDMSTDMLVHFEPDLASNARQRVADFVASVASLYEDNPYHNFKHAVDVTAACFRLLCNLKACESLGQQTKFTLLLASLMHDIAHPGFTNHFVSQTWDSPLWAKLKVIIFEDESGSSKECPTAPIETMHALLAVKLVTQYVENGQLFNQFSIKQTIEVTTMLPKLIMATDLAGCHTVYMEILDNGTIDDWQQPENQLLLCQLILKASDVSNAARGFHLFWKWSMLVQKEFHMQGDQEAELRLPVSPGFCRATADPIKSCVGFLKFIALPFFEKLAQVFPEMGALLDNVKTNLRCLEHQQLLQQANQQNAVKMSLLSNGQQHMRASHHAAFPIGVSCAKEICKQRRMSSPAVLKRSSWHRHFVPAAAPVVLGAG